MLMVTTLIISVVVPFLSVYAAQRLVRRDALRQDARKVFLRISKDMQAYRLAFLAHYVNVVERSPGAQQSEWKLQELITALNSDRLLIGLVFGEKAASLAKRIVQISLTATLLSSEASLPPLDQCKHALNEAIGKVGLEEMKPLWDSIQGRKPLWDSIRSKVARWVESSINPQNDAEQAKMTRNDGE